jgi:hypothetical protein
MRRFIPWTDIAVYGGLAVLSVVGAVWAALTPQEWEVGGIVVLIVVPLAFVVLAGVVVGRKLLSRPSFVVRGMGVWTCPGQGEHIKSRMDAALAHLIHVFPSIMRGRGFAEGMEPGKLGDALKDLLIGARCMWREGPLTVFSRLGWAVKDKAGLQSGKSIMVQWTGTISGSAWHHEIGHMVRQLVLKKQPDYKHEDREWWDAVRELTTDSIEFIARVSP